MGRRGWYESVYYDKGGKLCEKEGRGVMIRDANLSSIHGHGGYEKEDVI